MNSENSFCGTHLFKGTQSIFYYVYVLYNVHTGMFYIGMTSNLKRRLKEHKEGKSTFTRRNRKNGRWILIYFEGYRSKEDAEGREKFLKGGSGRKYLYR